MEDWFISAIFVPHKHSMKVGHNLAHPLQRYYDRIYKTYDLVNRIFTFGLDQKWRTITVDTCLAGKPESILDLCCGTGDMAISLYKKATYPVKIAAYDLNAHMLKIAKAKAAKTNANITFSQGDAGSMPFKAGEFNAITIGFGFRNLTWENPHQHENISEISRVLGAKGRLYILESAKPKNRLIRTGYHMYLNFFLIPLGGLLSGDWNAYRYLAGSSSGFYSVAELETLLKPYNLVPHVARTFLFGSANLIVVQKQEC